MATATLPEALRKRLKFPKTSKDGLSTMREIADSLGLSVLRAKAMLHELHREGRLQAGRTYRADLSGRMQSVPGYSLKK